MSCSVVVCDRPSRKRGMCEAHWRWSYNNGWRTPTHEVGKLPPAYKHDLHLDDMTPSEIAWCAGLFEGEGSMGDYSTGQGYTSPRVTINMTDRDVLEKFARYVGGKVVGPYGSREGHKKTYTIRYAGQQAIDLAYTLYPYLCSRRRDQVEAVLFAARMRP